MTKIFYKKTITSTLILFNYGWWIFLFHTNINYVWTLLAPSFQADQVISIYSIRNLSYKNDTVLASYEISKRLTR